MEMLCTHEFGILIVGVGHEEGHILIFFRLVPLSLHYDPKQEGKFWRLKKSIFQRGVMQFCKISRTGETVHGTL